MTTPEHICCHLGCEARPEFEIHYDTPDPYDSSTACADHVGHLMQDGAATVVPFALAGLSG